MDSTTEPTGPTESTVFVPPEPTPPAPLSIADILADTDLVLQKEAVDKATLESVGTISVEDLRTRLILWGRSGFPNAHTIHTVTLAPPTLCSDGVSRTLDDYILFCSGKTLTEHVALLQAKVASDIQIGFANFGGFIAIVVSKA